MDKMSNRSIVGAVVAAAGMTGLYMHIDYSGWVLFCGLFMLVFE